MCLGSNLQDEMTDLTEVSSEIQDTLGRSYSVPDDIDEEELLGDHLRVLQKKDCSRSMSTRRRLRFICRVIMFYQFSTSQCACLEANIPCCICIFMLSCHVSKD